VAVEVAYQAVTDLQANPDLTKCSYLGADR